MNIKPLLSAFAIIGITTVSNLAVAATVDVTYAGSANFGVGPVGYLAGAIAPNPKSESNLVGILIGGDSFTTDNLEYDFSLSGQFNAWCVDIYHWMIGGTVTYNVASGSELATELSSLRPGTSGEIRVNKMIQLANQVYSLVDTKIESAAFQLAIWKIAYGTPDNIGQFQIDETDTNFKVNDDKLSFVILANDWLNNLATAKNTGNYTLTYLHDGSHNNTQDVIVFTDPPLTVPEPSSITLISLGLAGFAFLDGKKLL